MCAHWFPGAEPGGDQSHDGKVLWGRVKKMKKMLQRGRHTEAKFFELLLAELDELRAFEEYMQATVGNIEKHIVHVERCVRGRDMNVSSESSGSHADINEESSDAGTAGNNSVGGTDKGECLEALHKDHDKNDN